MKQTISIRRVETRTLSIETLQALSTETLTGLVNDQLSGIASPGFGQVLAQQLTDWSVTRAEPSCECIQPKAKRKGR